jgi:hypothetical protein
VGKRERNRNFNELFLLFVSLELKLLIELCFFCSLTRILGYLTEELYILFSSGTA